MKKCAWLAVGVLSLFATGCGGGSAGSTAPGGGGDSSQPFSSGSFEGRAAATNPPVTTAAQTSVATGITGNFSQLKLREQNFDANDVRIAFSSSRSGIADVYTISLTGANMFRVTSTLDQKEGYVAFNPSGNKIAVTAMQPDGSNDLFIYRSDGILIERATFTPNVNESYPSWSPDGTKIVFENGSNSLSIYDTSAKTVTPLNTGSGDAFQPDWSSRNLIAFQTSRDGSQHLYSVSPNGSNLQKHLTKTAELYPKWDPEGLRLFAAEFNGGNFGIFQEAPVGGGNYVATVAVDLVGNLPKSKPILAPDGDNFYILSVDDKILNVPRAFGGEITTLYQGVDPIGSFDVQPLLKDRLMIGAGGLLATGGAGFIYADAGSRTQCCLAFDATTRSSAILRAVTGIGGTEDSLVFSLDADTVKLIKYANAPDWNAVSVVEAGTSTPTANGALISIDAAFGRVNAVLPFNGSRGADSKPAVTRQGLNYVFTGNFTSVVNGSGKNVAPSGASRVVLDPKTGKLTVS